MQKQFSLLTLAILLTNIIVSLSLPSPKNIYTREELEDSEKRFYQMAPGICRSNADCPEDHCCILGMMRYSVPTCYKYGDLNEPCIPTNPAPRNFSLSYPSLRTPIDVPEAYLLYCPCDMKHSCDRSTNSCLPRKAE